MFFVEENKLYFDLQIIAHKYAIYAICASLSINDIKIKTIVNLHVTSLNMRQYIALPHQIKSLKLKAYTVNTVMLVTVGRLNNLNLQSDQ